MIIFTFDIDTLLDSLQLQSMYKADTILDSSLSAADDTVVSDGDREMCMGFLKTGATKLSYFLTPYSRNLRDSNGLVIPAMEFDTTPERQIVFRVEMPPRWDPSLAPLLDDALENALTSFVLEKMARLRAIAFESYHLAYEQALDSVRDYLTQRMGPSDRPFSFY